MPSCWHLWVSSKDPFNSRLVGQTTWVRYKATSLISYSTKREFHKWSAIQQLDDIIKTGSGEKTTMPNTKIRKQNTKLQTIWAYLQCCLAETLQMTWPCCRCGTWEGQPCRDSPNTKTVSNNWLGGRYLRVHSTSTEAIGGLRHERSTWNNIPSWGVRTTASLAVPLPRGIAKQIAQNNGIQVRWQIHGLSSRAPPKFLLES
jgi:hypothetical protein